jgi:hypothetical protein
MEQVSDLVIVEDDKGESFLVDLIVTYHLDKAYIEVVTMVTDDEHKEDCYPLYDEDQCYFNDKITEAFQGEGKVVYV